MLLLRLRIRRSTAFSFSTGRFWRLSLPWLSDVTRAKRPVRVPLVLSRSEVRAVLATLQSPHDLIVRLLYGSGLRVGEATRLRIKDLDFKRRSLIVRDGKGAKDRITVLPDSVVPALKLQIEKSLAVWCAGQTAQPVAASFCRMRWTASIRMPGLRTAGSSCFRGAQSVDGSAFGKSCAGIMYSTALYSVQ